jgi:peptidoglycan/xylan/chitin deacetylase (PgdA/CDA1 family)
MDEHRYATSWREAAPLPKGLTGNLRSWARSAILFAQSARAQPDPKPFLRGLYCHYVFDDQREDFERAIVELKSLGQFVDTETCLDILEGRRKLDGHYFHLSFDDGFRNVFTNAAPILQKEQIPAVVFVPTRLIGASWEETAHFCLKRGDYRAVIEMMRWEELQQLVDYGIDVGSHTRTHARLSKISCNERELEDEIRGSKQDLEDQLGRPCHYFSWPFGRPSDADAKSLAMVRTSGYRACFGAYRGSIHPGQTDPLAIPRHHFEPQWPLAHIRYFACGNMETPDPMHMAAI